MKKILINSLPKSGTHLLMKLFLYFGYNFSGLNLSSTTIYGGHNFAKFLLRGPKPCFQMINVGLDISCCVNRGWIERKINKISNGYYIGGHLPYSDALLDLMESNGFECIHIVRDPRDVLLSWAHYVAKSKWHYGYEGLHGLQLDAAVLKILNGYSSGGFYIESFREILNKSYGWFECSHVVKFEDLVGNKGGGSDDIQKNIVREIARFADYNKDELEGIADKLFGGTKVFRKGQVGAWKDELSSKSIDSINTALGRYIVKFGYFA